MKDEKEGKTFSFKRCTSLNNIDILGLIRVSK